MGNQRTERSTRGGEIERATVTVPLATFAGQPFLLPEHSTYRQVFRPEVTLPVSHGYVYLLLEYWYLVIFSFFDH